MPLYILPVIPKHLKHLPCLIWLTDNKYLQLISPIPCSSIINQYDTHLYSKIYSMRLIFCGNRWPQAKDGIISFHTSIISTRYVH